MRKLHAFTLIFSAFSPCAFAQPAPSVPAVQGAPTPAPRPCEPEAFPGELAKMIPRFNSQASDVTTKPEVISRTQPGPFSALWRQGVHGKVILEAIVESDGAIRELRVLQSPDPRLSRLACDSLYEWRYKPGTLNGKPIPIYTIVTFTFEAKLTPPPRND